MNIYISGISGTGMGPLALMAKAAGFSVCGSDIMAGAIYDELVEAGVEVKIGPQNGDFLREKLKNGVDWFVYTSALPADHAELKMAKAAGVKVSKRDELTAFLVKELGLLMVAVAGTHGKTTTTSMIVWAASKLGLPVSYIVGTTLGFLPSGKYARGDKFFVYEADEYDRNFLKFHPWLAVITHVSYDHPDIYATREEYVGAFREFEAQSKRVINEVDNYDNLKLAGEVRRKDAGFAREAVMLMAKEMGKEISREDIEKVLNEFPGVGRRFERISDGLYTDYAHHPEEIAATMNVAIEEARMRGKRGVVVIYQPHQNVRQHEVKDGYKDAFLGADKVFWLPTYLTREDLKLKVLAPEELYFEASNKEVIETAKISGELEKRVREYLAEDFLVILMTAGPADEWFRGLTSC